MTSLPHGESLLSAEFDSIPRGYKWLSEQKQNSSWGVLEASIIPPGRFVALISGAAAPLKQLRQSLESDEWGPAISAYVEKANQEVVDALYALRKQALGEALLTVEAPSISKIIRIAHASLDNGLKPIDIRTQRMLGQKAILFATGTKAQVQAALDSIHKNFSDPTDGVEASCCETSSPIIRDLF